MASTQPDEVVATVGLCRSFQQGTHVVRAVERVSLRVNRGALVAVVGPSGSGKSTLLHLIAGLDRPTAGEIIVEGQRLDQADRGQLARFRREHLGIVFQAFNLFPRFSLVENVEFPLLLAGVPAHLRRSRAIDALERVDLRTRRDTRASLLSGGEQQRGAIARALVHRPGLLLADELTGNLDSANTRLICQLLQNLQAEGQTALITTHNPEVAAIASTIMHMRDGRLTDRPDPTG